MIGYGGMLMESFVGISALIAASVIIDQGLYFAINSPAGRHGARASPRPTGQADDHALHVRDAGGPRSRQLLVRQVREPEHRIDKIGAARRRTSSR